MITVERMPDDWMAQWLRDRQVTMQNPNGSNSVHRVQVIRVRRGEILYEEQTDLGEESRFNGEPLMVVAGGLTSVGKVRDLASRERGEKTFAEEMGLEVPTGAEFLDLYRQAASERFEIASHRSVFGSAYVRVRS